MKIRLALLMAIAVSCGDSREDLSDPFPSHLFTDESMIIYEGFLPAEDGDSVLVELTLVPGAPGLPSYYTMKEGRWEDNGIKVDRGTYDVLVGGGGERIIHITDKKRWRAVIRGSNVGPEDWVRQEVILGSRGHHELVLLNDDFNISVPSYSLFRRSPLFTVEGYFTAYNDTAEYFERNTGKTWPVARFAYYPDVVKKYHLLATEKFEGVYLKALSYSVRQPGPSGDEVEALVFKKVLQMDSTSGKLIH